MAKTIDLAKTVFSLMRDSPALIETMASEKA